MMLRRTMLAVLFGLVATRSDAGDLYYRTPGDSNGTNIYAVNENGGIPRVVLHGAEYAPGSMAGMTRFNHVGSNGQALVQAKPFSAPSADIQNASQDGGIWACYADSPGVLTWVARPLTKTSKTQTVKEEVRYPLWRPDGQRIACAYTKYTTTRSGTTREQQPAVMAPTGWPVVKLLSRGTTLNWHTPLGWTP